MPQISREQAVSISRISSLVVVNALIFQEILSNDDGRVYTLRQILDRTDLVGELENHWSFILHDIDYYPIFDVARSILISLTSGRDSDRALRSLASVALGVVRQRAALRHDLMGRVYHRLLAERETKSLATFYTSVPAATLLLKLALNPAGWNTTWCEQDEISAFRVADLACGTGTLLMAAAEVITDNYVRSCMEEARSPDFDLLQRWLVQDMIFGYDVLPSARHLTASTLALRAPKVKFESMNLWSLPFGEPGQRLGSIEFLINRSISIQDFNREAGSIERTSATQRAQETTAYLPDLDLCVMNPPFTRSSHANLLFGSLPDSERLALQKRLARLLKEQNAEATGTAGLGSVFVATGDRALKQGGRMALVLPKAILSGGAWELTRQLFSRKYDLEYVLVSHDPERWNFSDNTNLSETLLIARKKNSEAQGESDKEVICVNLWRNPRTSFEALSVADSLVRGRVPNLENTQGSLDIMVGGQKFGEAVATQWHQLRDGLWMEPCSFAQNDLARTVHHLMRGRVHLPGIGDTGRVLPLTQLKELGELGPDIRDIYDGFQVTNNPTPFPSYWGHDARTTKTMSQRHNAYLSPLSSARPGRHLRKALDLWPKASRIAIATRLRMNTQRVSAVRLESKVLSNVWWPFAMLEDNMQAEKALVLWLNCTLGLLILLAHRQEVQGSWMAFQKPVLNVLPVLDTGRLPHTKIEELASAYDSLEQESILPFHRCEQDSTRQQIDEAIVEAFDLPNMSILRELFAREPIVSNTSLGS